MSAEASSQVVHLVSDSTGETVTKVFRACLAQFEEMPILERLWSFKQLQPQIDAVLAEIKKEPGPVFFSLVDKTLSTYMTDSCRRLNVPYADVLDPVMSLLERTLGAVSSRQPGVRHELDEAYFSRMEAVDFTLHHDDGAGTSNLHQADVILVGVSRMSKTPCCIYLSYRGIRAANVPLIPNQPLPESLMRLTESEKRPLIVALTQDATTLLQARQHRLEHLSPTEISSEYIDPFLIQEEVTAARRLFSKHGWPVIDVTRRSVEETAALIIQSLNQHIGEQRYTL